MGARLWSVWAEIREKVPALPGGVFVGRPSTKTSEMLACWKKINNQRKSICHRASASSFLEYSLYPFVSINLSAYQKSYPHAYHLDVFSFFIFVSLYVLFISSTLWQHDAARTQVFSGRGVFLTHLIQLPCGLCVVDNFLADAYEYRRQNSPSWAHYRSGEPIKTAAESAVTKNANITTCKRC